MAILGTEGDTKVIWDAENEHEVDAAKAQFDILIKKGFSAFKVKKDGEAGKKIKYFDPNAGSIIMVPMVAGG